METKQLTNLGLVIVAVILAIGIVALAGAKFPIQGEEKRTLQASETVEKTVDPNLAEVYLGVRTLKNTSTQSQEENSEISQGIISALKSLGIKEEDIETYRYQHYEKKDYTWRETRSLGYETVHILKIRTEELDLVGEIIDKASEAGANDVDNIKFTLTREKEMEVKEDVLGQAAVKAKEKAEHMADSLGISLGKINSVSESNFYYSPYTRTLGEYDSAGSTPIQPSKVDVSATVSVSYEIN